jgi:hypothetical protein
VGGERSPVLLLQTFALISVLTKYRADELGEWDLGAGAFLKTAISARHLVRV